MSLRKISILVTMGALVGVPAALGSGSALPKLPSQAGPGRGELKVKPTSIGYTGDGSGFFAGGPRSNHRPPKPLNWSSWTATGANGSGFNWVNNCSPNCAAGTFRRFAVRLHAYRPRKAGGHLIFTRMRVTYTGKHRSTQIWKVVHQNGGYFYNFPEG